MDGKIVIIGGRALERRLRGTRQPKDTDFIAPLRVGSKYVWSRFARNPSRAYPIDNGQKWIYTLPGKYPYEHSVAFQGSVLEDVYNYVIQDPNSMDSPTLSPVKSYTFRAYYPSLNVLYAIKMSHRFLRNSPHFHKTMDDIHLMRDNGAVIPEDFKEIYKGLEKKHYDYSHPKLNQNKTEFFTDDVPYKYDHDTIHLAVKNLDKPAYQFFKPEENEVLCSKSMFNELDENIKLLAVLEESYVLALERAIIPFGITDREKIKDRFLYALQKVCTSITSGWFRDYSWENYHKVVDMYNPDFYDKFQSALVEGRILPYVNN